jgi:hypothetical protein
MLSETFWSIFVGLGFTFLGLTIKACLRSKCDNIEFCGIKIHRNVEIEEKIDEMEIGRGGLENNMTRI